VYSFFSVQKLNEFKRDSGIEARVSGVLWETVLSCLPEELERAMTVCVQETKPDTEAIKAASMRNEEVTGAEVRRGSHLRVA
jgi:hypothetical protein